MKEDLFAQLIRESSEPFEREEREGGKILQRERLVELQAMAKTGRIQGLLSLDSDPLRSFSANPIDNPFGIDRVTWPDGHWSYNPRFVVYYKKLSIYPEIILSRI